MARSTVAFTNFTAGELSPRLEGRTDLGKYFNGSKTLENMVVHPHGGASRRPGTQFVHEVKTSSAQTRLIPFEFSTTQTYILELGNQYIRFFKDKGIITEANKTITGVTQANPAVVTISSHGYSNGDYVIITGVVGMTQLNGKTFKVAGVSTNTFQLQTVDAAAINSSGYTAYSSGGVANKIYEIASPYATADIPTVKFAQSADTMYLVHPSYAIRKLTRSAHTNWTISTPSLSGSPSPTINNASDKYPSSVSFFEQRLVFAGSNDNPQTMWFSKSADLENFTTGTNDTDAMGYTIASNKVNAIRYISAQRSLIVGTVGGEFVVSASGTTQPITPTNVQIQKQSSYGSANIDAVQIENVTMFVQRAKRKLRELSYNLSIDQYQAQDMTLLAEHITEGGILEMAYQQEPDSILWCIRSDGTLLGFTYARAEEVVGWHRHILGGVFGSGQSVIESVATIPTDSNEDELWMIVKRTVNGATRRYVEYLNLFDYGTDQKDGFFVDCGLTYSGSATTSISGLDHLEGQSVTILADGATHPAKTVSGGAITLDRSSSKVHVGLSYISLLQTMRVESPGNESTSQAKTKRINEVTLRLHETVGVEVGASLSDMERIPFRSSAAAMNTAVPLFTGDKQVEFRDDFNTDGFVFVRQNQPLPLTLISIYPQITIND